VARLAEALNDEENRAEAADLLRSLIDCIRLTPTEGGRLEIDLQGDLAGILSLATNDKGPLDASGPYVQQDKVVAGRGFEPLTFRL
jgi:site-specific DNA recombinase